MYPRHRLSRLGAVPDPGAHRRIRDSVLSCCAIAGASSPPSPTPAARASASGGVSVLSESVAVDPELRPRDPSARAARLARRGDGRIQAAICATGQPELMEINGRFWGSLAAGDRCGRRLSLSHLSAGAGPATGSSGPVRRWRQEPLGAGRSRSSRGAAPPWPQGPSWKVRPRDWALSLTSSGQLHQGCAGNILRRDDPALPLASYVNTQRPCFVQRRRLRRPLARSSFAVSSRTER